MNSRLRKLVLTSALAGAGVLLPVSATSAQAVVQALPPPELNDLQRSLSVLAKDPADLSALLDAGKASIALDDLQAALGFFRRALSVSPNNGAAEAGIAAISLRQGNPVEAVRMFEQAERDGMPPGSHASDHGLALDLVGDNDGAQRFYRQALSQGDDPEVTRRLALSLAIAGDQHGSETTLLPLLQHRDLAAYRTRAFALAILGRSDDAVSIAQTMLPERLSNRMAPYLRYMPRLTRAQQAAAANLGKFPPAAEIGRDSPEIAALSARSAPRQVAARTPDSRLEPTGEPLGSSKRPPKRTRDREAAAKPAADKRVVVGKVVAATSTPIEPPPQSAAPSSASNGGSASARTGEPAAPAPVLVAAAEPPPAPANEPVVVAAQPPAPQPAQSGDLPRPSLSVGNEAPPEPAPVEDEPELSLAEAFADLAEPPADAGRPRNGAVDITKFEPPRQKPPPPPAPKPPANPKRYWVQVATGRDIGSLGFDWRRIQRKAGPLLKSNDAFTASWGQTNRLVTGPYDSEAEALKTVKSLKDKGLDTFAFTSEQGEEVRPLK